MAWDDSDNEDDWETNLDQLNAPNLPPAAPTPSFQQDDDEEVVSDDEVTTLNKPQAKKKGDGKIKAKKATKQKQKELAAALEKEAEAAKEMKPMTKEEKVAEKLRLQRLVEEADHALTDDLFNTKKAEGKLDVDAIAAMLQNVPLEDEKEYKNFANAVARRVEIEDKAFLTKEFFKELCRSLAKTISGDDIAEVISVLGVVKNEIVKQKMGKKKKKVKAKFANVARNDFDLDGTGMGGPSAYEDNDLDGDFM